MDPLASKYPYYSSYQFSGNRLIDCIDLEGKEPEGVVKTIWRQTSMYGKPAAPVVVNYKFTEAAAHLLSLVSRMAETDIRNININNGYGTLFPMYDPYKGGGAITLPTGDGGISINLTDNFFDYNHHSNYGEKDFYKSVDRWLHLSSHEVGHLKDVEEIGQDGLSKYLAVFAVGYATSGSHDDYWREERADRGQHEYELFNKFINDTYGKGNLRLLFEDKTKTDSDKIKTIDGW